MRSFLTMMLCVGGVAAISVACGDVAKTADTGSDGGAEGGAGGACSAPDIGRLENGGCTSGSGAFGVDENTPACCRPCTAGEVVSHPAGMAPRCVLGDGGAGGDAAVGDGAACPMYTAADKACMTAADCTTVAIGCYCGAQPVIGIAKSISALASACEAESAKTCARGCANSPGQVAEDGNNEQDGGSITVKCDMGACHTVVQ